jgi:hypothetical protein
MMSRMLHEHAGAARATLMGIAVQVLRILVEREAGPSAPDTSTRIALPLSTCMYTFSMRVDDLRHEFTMPL